MSSETTPLRKITLFSQAGGSDKFYMLQMHIMDDSSYKLYYANGKRGAAIKLREKTKIPLTKEEAEKEFEVIINKKKKDKSQYKESLDNGETLEVSPKSGKESGIETHLLVQIDEARAIELCNDDNYVAQEKHDGERRPFLIKDNNIFGTNRYGEFTGGMTSTIKNAVDLSDNVIFDTEDMGAFLFAFDIIEYQGEDLRNKGFIERFNILKEVAKKHSCIRVSPLAQTTEEKLALLQKMIDNDREGIVFKLINSPYVGGKATKTKATQFKFKLYDEASVMVESINVKRSVLMALFNDDGVKDTWGSVRIPENTEMPEVGDVIEVKYLYAFKDGSMYQSSFLKHRKDQRITECLESQLKYKPVIV
jgi:bifunctional non-homologous end joining protein LigD